MNERIKELIEQATTKREFYPAGCNGYPEYRYDFDQEKFADLILQDVMNLFGDERISLHYLEQPCCEDSVLLLQTKIQEHFGIK